MSLQENEEMEIQTTAGSEEKKTPDLMEPEKKKSVHTPKIEISNDMVDQKIAQLKFEQNSPFAILTGTLAMLIGSIIWAVVTALTKYQIAWMAVGVGFLVGIAIRHFGKAVDTHFGVLGAILALGGCLLGKLFTIVIMVANQYDVTIIAVLKILNMETIMTAMKESFQAIDLLFYGLAVYYGFKQSFEEINYDAIKHKLKQEKLGTGTNQTE